MDNMSNTPFTDPDKTCGHVKPNMMRVTIGSRCMSAR